MPTIICCSKYIYIFLVTADEFEIIVVAGVAAVQLTDFGTFDAVEVTDVECNSIAFFLSKREAVALLIAGLYAKA